MSESCWDTLSFDFTYFNCQLGAGHEGRHYHKGDDDFPTFTPFEVTWG